MAVWSEVRFSDLPADLRLDAEYYAPEILALRTSIERSRYPVQRLQTLSSSIINFGAYSLCNEIRFLESGIPYITAENILDGFIDFASARRISSAQHAGLLWKSKVSSGQVLVAMAARLGYAAVYDKSAPLNSSQDIAKVTLADPKATDPFYVAAFINSRLGRSQLLASRSGSVQQHTNLGKIKELRVVVPPTPFQRAVAETYRKALTKMEQAQSYYAEAESLLLDELGLADLDLSPQLFCERRYSETVAAHRLDAEYFQPKYYRIGDRLKKAAQKLKAGNVASFSGAVKYGTSEKLTYTEAGNPFLRIADLNNRRFDLDSVLRIPDAQARQEKAAQVRAGDVLISRSGTLGIAVPIPPELDGAIFGSYFIRIRTDATQIDPEFFALYMNSICGSLQVERLTTGGVQTNLTIPAIKSLFVIMGGPEWQKPFVGKVRQSVEARQESQRLLDTAKHTVEIAIAESEAAALQFLRKQQG